jgi:hypothetical protein
MTSEGASFAIPASSSNSTRTPTPQRPASAFGWLIGVPFYRRDWYVAPTASAYFTCCQDSLFNTALIVV